MQPSPRFLPSQRGLALMLGASIGFSIMNALAKHISSHGVPSAEIAAVRATVGATGIFLASRARSESLRVLNVKIMLVRMLAGTTAMLATFYALSVLPLAQAVAFLNTTPLFVAALGWFVLRERPSPLVVAALLIGFLGVIVLLHPSVNSDPRSFIALGASVFSAIAMMSLRKLGESERAETVVFWLSLFAALVSGAVAFGEAVIPSPVDVGLMIITGVAASVAQVWMTQAYQLDVAARVGGAGYLTVVFGACAGVLFFGESLEPASFLGVAIILLSGALLVTDARRSPST